MSGAESVPFAGPVALRVAARAARIPPALAHARPARLPRIQSLAARSLAARSLAALAGGREARSEPTRPTCGRASTEAPWPTKRGSAPGLTRSERTRSGLTEAPRRVPARSVRKHESASGAESAGTRAALAARSGTAERLARLPTLLGGEGSVAILIESLGEVLAHQVAELAPQLGARRERPARVGRRTSPFDLRGRLGDRRLLGRRGAERRRQQRGQAQGGDPAEVHGGLQVGRGSGGGAPRVR